MRLIAEGDLAAFCLWLGAGLDGQAELLSGSFPAQTLHADLLVRLGPQRLLHVEYMRDAQPDLSVRMAGYRFRIMEKHPGHGIQQFAIILGDGHVISCDDPHNGFFLGLRTIYLRDCPPEPLLAQPALAPLAVLARGATGRELAGALATIKAGPPGPQQDALLEATAVLATIRLDVHTIDRIRRETGMTVESIADFYSATEVGRELLNRGNRRGIEQGLEQGLEQGVVATLTRLLRAKFGDQPGIEAAATRLAHWSDQDAVILAITRADDLSAIPADEAS